MEKKKLDSNFDRLKQSLLEKRLKAESNKNDNINVYTNADVDVNVDTNTNINTDKKENKSVNNNENININNSVNNNVNKFVIKSNTDEEALVRHTIYLKPDTINKINYFSEQLKLGKSELVRKILEETLDNLEII